MAPVVGEAVRIVPDVVKRTFSNIALDEHRRHGEAALDVSVALDADREDSGVAAQPEAGALVAQLVHVADQPLVLGIVSDVVAGEHLGVRAARLLLDDEIVDAPGVLGPDLHVAGGPAPGMGHLDLPRTDAHRRSACLATSPWPG